MIKILLPLVLIFGLISCSSSTESTDYPGQSYPDNMPVVFAPDIVSVKGRLEHGISFTPDMQELVFGILHKDDFSGDILYSRKVKDDWIEPRTFEPLKGESVFLPYFSPDGRSMLYAQSQPDTNNGFTDIWILKKHHDTWGYPEKVDSPVSTSTRESTACMTLDNTLYFSSNRDGNGLADLYSSSLDNGKYLTVERLDSVCSVRDEESIFVSPDERYMIFSRYATNENGPDLFISHQDSKRNWTKPMLLDSAINTANWERRPFVTIDHKFLFFTKLFFDQSGLTESDIYWVNTQQVFKPFVFNPITKKTIKIGQQTRLTIPSDYFKDIDDDQLEITFNNENIRWAEFDDGKRTLIMNPDEIGAFDLIFTAVDKYSNKTKDRVKIIVEE